MHALYPPTHMHVQGNVNWVPGWSSGLKFRVRVTVRVRVRARATATATARVRVRVRVKVRRVLHVSRGSPPERLWDTHRTITTAHPHHVYHPTLPLALYLPLTLALALALALALDLTLTLIVAKAANAPSIRGCPHRECPATIRA